MADDLRNVGRVLRLLADALERGDTGVLSRIAEAIGASEPVSREAALTAAPVAAAAPVASLPRKKASPKASATVDVGAAIDELSRFETREEAEIFLRSGYRTKAALSQVAQALQVHIGRTDRAPEIVEKIVNATVGRRMGAKAIRG